MIIISMHSNEGVLTKQDVIGWASDANRERVELFGSKIGIEQLYTFSDSK